MSCCACCCFYPKYKRKVDNIYPRPYDAPLIKIELEKLTYYVKQHPEKLSKVGDYLYQHLKWGLQGSYKSRNYVKNTIEAVDKILLVITPQNLNYYAANYFKIIQKLLEQGANQMSGTSDGVNTNFNSEYLEYQKLAASLFRKFCDKEACNQSAANYNLNYDSFVCQFSSMCYNNNRDENTRAEIRSSGLQCLATMVKRLVPEESLSASFIWENMDKILPALLFIMQESYLKVEAATNSGADLENANEDDAEMDRALDRYIYGDFYIHSRTKDNLASQENLGTDPDDVRVEFRKGSTTTGGNNISASNSDEAGAVFLINRKNSVELVDPDHEAKMLLKNLACKADYTTISKIVLPILSYLDANKPSGWEYSRFVRCIFLILMYNVKQQHAIVIKELIKHLDSHVNSSAKLKCNIIRAISTCIRIAAMHSVGTTGQIIEIFTYLLKHLKSSVEKVSTLQSQLITKKTVVSSNTSSTSMSSLQQMTNSAGPTAPDTSVKINRDLLEEQNLQRKIIDAMGQFTANLPDYSKNDVVMFIARQINSQQFTYLDAATANQSQPVLQPTQQNAKDQACSQLRSKYFECLHEICTKYRPTQLFGAFTSVPFLEDILRLTLVADWASRRKAHEVLHLLLDKYQLLDKIKDFKPDLFNQLLSSSSGTIAVVKKNLMNKSSNSLYMKQEISQSNTSLKSGVDAKGLTRNQTYLSRLELSENKMMSSREDVQFMRKYGRRLLAHLNENLFLTNNRRENYESIFLTSCLFIIGLYNENEFLVDLIRFGFHVQELALLNHEQTTYFSLSSQCNVHKFVCAFFLLLSKSSSIPALYDYCSEICSVRRKKPYYQYIYPEYILLNPAPTADNFTKRNSTADIEVDFKRELKDSAKEYFSMVRKFEEEKIARSNPDETDSKKSLIDLVKENNKMAGWLFDKKKIADIVESAGFNTEKLYEPNSEYSLSVSYLQHHVASLQTALKFRSPYSNSLDSFANLPTETSVNFNQVNGNSQIPHSGTSGNIAEFYSSHHSRKHSRGFSHGGHIPFSQTGLGPSSSTHQLGSTPRRSIDVESNLDEDDTSYDSTSLYSTDQNNLDIDQRLFYIDPQVQSDANQLTVTSTSAFSTNRYELNTFETIRRVLINGNGNATSTGGSLVNGNAISVTSSMNNPNKSYNHLYQQQNHGISEVQKDDDLSSVQSDQIEKSEKIISDFKEKTFDEQKKTLLRTNQETNEKYQQVFDFISKELTSISATSTGSEKGISVNGNSVVQKNSLLNGNSGSTSNISNNPADNSNLSANSLNSSSSIAVSGQPSIPLNDIEFPKLFIY